MLHVYLVVEWDHRKKQKKMQSSLGIKGKFMTIKTLYNEKIICPYCFKQYDPTELDLFTHRLEITGICATCRKNSK